MTWRANIVTAAQLRSMQFPAPVDVVPGLIPVGLGILAGRPKIGKSWLALDLCIGVAGDRDVLGGFRPVPGDVLYCALEDTNARLKRRIHKLGGDWPERLTFATRWRRLDNGGVDDIAEWASSVLAPCLVVLDTLAGVRPERQRSDTTYEGDYKALTEIHKLANKRGFAALALHHTRKMEADDPIDTISGTLGIAGCADTSIVLARTPKGTTLYVRGRDIQEAEHAITFNSDTCRWTILGDATEARRSETRSAIIAALDKNPDGPMRPEEISQATGIKRNTIDQRLPDMVKDGEITKVARGLYLLPDRI